jgi:hypothetical protein
MAKAGFSRTFDSGAVGLFAGRRPGPAARPARDVFVPESGLAVLTLSLGTSCRRIGIHKDACRWGSRPAGQRPAGMICADESVDVAPHATGSHADAQPGGPGRPSKVLHCVGGRRPHGADISAVVSRR